MAAFEAKTIFCISSETRLGDMNIPQVIKSEHISQGRQPVFAYKRNAAIIAWPMAVKKQQGCWPDTSP